MIYFDKNLEILCNKLIFRLYYIAKTGINIKKTITG